MREEILRISNVSKKYRLGMIGGTTLKDELQRKRAARKGLEDPTKKIGERQVGNIGDEFLALDDINITVYEGERVGIIGHNGAGKSTLLKLISQITEPTGGTIEMNGRIASMLEVGTGFHPELSGRENIYMNGAILGMTKAEIDQKIEDIIDFSECKQFIDTPVKRYSSGMYVKLAFSVAAHLDSEIMIMDEVLAVGDMAFQKKCLEKMSQVSQNEGRTILYVSHNMNTIRQLCDRVIVLEHGRKVYDGETEKGISLYLNAGEKKDIFIDLHSLGRDVKSNQYIHINSFMFMGVDSNIYTRGQVIKMRVNWHSDKRIEGYRFRLVIRKNDDTPVGMAQSEILQPVDAQRDEVNCFGFDTSLLADGEYIISFGFFHKDEYGNETILDHVSRVTCFEICSSENDERKIVWQPRSWGAISFPLLEKLED